MVNPVVYTGPSMNKTLIQGDLLEVVAYWDANVKIGDVIYFQSLDGNYVVHRVVGKDEEGYITQGDNNPSHDPDSISMDRIIGQVQIIQRDGNNKTIYGGTIGLFFSYVNHFRQMILRIEVRLLHHAYYMLAESGFCQVIFQGMSKPKIVGYQIGNHHIMFKLIYLKREIGQYDQDKKKWILKPPFHLFVRKNCLYPPC